MGACQTEERAIRGVSTKVPPRRTGTPPAEWLSLGPQGHGDDQPIHGTDQTSEPTPERRFSRVLVVDDDEGVARQLRWLLEDEGYQVEVAATGALGLVAIRESTFDVAILDVRLPDLSGIEVFEAVRAQAASVKTIIVSGFLVDEEIASVRTRGAHFLAKPVDATALLSLLANLERGKGDGR
jgi:ActR/RegA family two-component response regulator